MFKLSFRFALNIRHINMISNVSAPKNSRDIFAYKNGLYILIYYNMGSATIAQQTGEESTTPTKGGGLNGGL